MFLRLIKVCARNYYRVNEITETHKKANRKRIFPNGAIREIIIGQFQHQRGRAPWIEVPLYRGFQPLLLTSQPHIAFKCNTFAKGFLYIADTSKHYVKKQN